MIKAFYENSKLWGRKNSSRTAFEKIKISVLSIFIGFVFGTVILAIMKYNPFDVYSSVFTGAFKDSAKINQLLIFTSIFTLSGLANAVAFKTGLFNIGVSGQMLAAGGVSMLLGLTVLNGMDPVIAIPLLLIVAVATGVLVGLLVGFLKSKLNVNEVVSTILLNWIIFYIIKFIFRTSQSFVGGDGNSSLINKSYRFGGFSGDNRWVAMIIVALVLCVAIWAIFKYTTFGKKIKLTGSNKDASRYAGVNISVTTISSLVISTGIAGVLGFVYYMGYKHFLPQLQDTLPTEGFDGIAIALLAFSSPIAMPFVALFYSIFITGTQLSSLPSEMQQPIISLIFSIIIYLAAASSLFIRIKPIEFVRWMLAIKRDDEVKRLFTERKKEVHLYDLKGKIEAINSDSSLSKEALKSQILLAKFGLKNIKNDYSLRINDAFRSYSLKTIDLNYKSTWAYPKNEINNFYKEQISSSYTEFFQKTKSLSKEEKNIEKLSYKKHVSELTKIKKEKIKEASNSFSAILKSSSIKTNDGKNKFIKDIDIKVIKKAVK